MKLKRIKPVKGARNGVKFVPRGKDDPHILIQLLGEDDDNWFNSDGVMSSFWIDDLILTLQRAKETLSKKANPDRDGFGFEFKQK